MSDHAWTQENAAAFVAGGLTAEEAERLEAHTRDCPECAAAVADARRIDGGLRDLFADERPAPGLEDRAVRSTRTPRRRRIRISARMARFVVAAGVLVALGTVGAMFGDKVPLPGEASILVVKASPIDDSRSMKSAKRGEDWVEGESTRLALGRVDEPSLKSPDSGGDRKLVERATSRIQGGGADASKSNATPYTDWGLGTQQNRYGYSPDGKNFLSGITGLNSVRGLTDVDGSVTGDLNGTVVNGGTTQGIGANSLYFMPPSGPAAPGTPIQQRAAGNTFTAGGTLFGAYPQPTQNMPVAPVVPKGLGQGQSPQFSKLRYTDRLFGAQVASAAPFRPGEFRPAVPAEEKPPPTSHEDKPNPNDPKPPLATEPAEAAARRVIIRSGEMEFEVDSFDAATAVVNKLVANTKGAFVATINSDKLANGKVRGTITVRTPPEYLDKLVADLRHDLGGELKGLKIGSQDITKQYTDLESRLRAARTMEQRLLQIIKEGKGEIKDLLAAERELGVWRTKIEEIEGELRYYANLVGLSTLTIALTEKEIRVAATVTENERVQAGVEVEDVDKAYQQALTAVAEAKGRVAKSELKQLAAGQFNATLQFDVPPDAAGPMRDRLRQLGRVARLEIDRVQNAVGGTPPADGKVKRGDTTFLVQLYNLANIQPRETVALTVAAADVRAAFQTLRDAAGKSAGRVKVAQLNEQDAQNVAAQFDVEIRRSDEGTVRAALDAAGEVLARQVARAPEGDEFTDSKLLYRVTLISADRLMPRETTKMTLEVPDVEQTSAALAAQVAEAKGRQLSAESSRDRTGKVTAKLTYEVPLAAASLAERFKAAGTVRDYQSSRDPRAPSGKYATARFEVTLENVDRILAANDGLWPQVRNGLSYSATVLLKSVMWVVVGLCVVLPFGVVGYGGYRIVRRMVRPGT